LFDAVTLAAAAQPGDPATSERGARQISLGALVRALMAVVPPLDPATWSIGEMFATGLSADSRLTLAALITTVPRSRFASRPFVPAVVAACC
jgi:hypothetical protein